MVVADDVLLVVGELVTVDVGVVVVVGDVVGVVVTDVVGVVMAHSPTHLFLINFLQKRSLQPKLPFSNSCSVNAFKRTQLTRGHPVTRRVVVRGAARRQSASRGRKFK